MTKGRVESLLPNPERGPVNRTKSLSILYEDNHLLVVNKPAGLLVQGDRTGDQDLLTLAKQYLKEKYSKPGNVFLGLVHRLDRPVSGVVVLARTSKAASRLSAQIRGRTVKKQYLALAEGCVPEHGEWQDYIGRRGVTGRIDQRGKQAVLSFTRIQSRENVSYVVIDLITGVHHQIRVQFASRGYPLLGDLRYGAHRVFPGRAVALHARSFSCLHPTRGEIVRFTAEPGAGWQKIAAYAASVHGGQEV